MRLTRTSQKQEARTKKKKKVQGGGRRRKQLPTGRNRYTSKEPDLLKQIVPAVSRKILEQETMKSDYLHSQTGMSQDTDFKLFPNFS